VTSLPEVFTGVSAMTLVNAPDITVGNIFGANTYNMLNLALLDLIHCRTSLLSDAKPGHHITAYFSISMLVVAILGIFLGNFLNIPALEWVGWYTPLILIIYVVAMRQLFIFERSSLADEEPLVTAKYAEIPARRMYMHFVVSAAFIIGTGIWLAMIGDQIAALTGWGQSFVGSLFIGFTLPCLK
jgi:cation:H+ antiporter